jgi:hypothetical protein
MINQVLEAPNAQSAWERIAAKDAHIDPDFDTISEPNPEED